MEVHIKKLVGWDAVLRTARTTVGKKDIRKEPSDDFKKSILISEHSPIRMLTYEVIWKNIPYFVAMHLRTHHIGFKATEDDIYFIQTSRSDRIQKDRNSLVQTAPVSCRAVLNAQSIINTSRVRLCQLSSLETRKAWKALIERLKETEPLLAKLCQPNCIYRARCPEGKNTCGYNHTTIYKKEINNYNKLFK